ncbi:MAG: hypothetical protein LBR23_00015 [Spirochaetaceae bacterium]|jgi:hypothetical protein|nr:hypothetical protein [Spirochaetaceae bacterium]
MQALEFSTVVENGSIRVPEHYVRQILSPVRVIILVDDFPRPMRKKRFNAAKLKTKGFKFNREELHER